ncbi:MAG: T9SS type A sorting domain-containing protein [Bacteroidota bacterium]
MPRTSVVLVLLLGALVATVPVSHAQSFFFVGNPPGATQSQADYISGDGTALAGFIQLPADQFLTPFAWSASAGHRLLPIPENTTIIGSRLGISYDGRVIAGGVRFSGSTPGDDFLALWTATAGGYSRTTLDLPFDYAFETGDAARTDVSDDGSVVVSTLTLDPDPFGDQRPIRWINGTPSPLSMQGLEDDAQASAVSGDGRIVGGFARLRVAPGPGVGTVERVAAIWGDGPPQIIGTVDADDPITGSEVIDVDSLGTTALVTLSLAERDANNFALTRTAIWTASGGLVELPLPAGAEDVFPRAISGDGTTVLAGVTLGPGDAARGYVWTAEAGWRQFEDLLAEAGLDDETEGLFISPTDMSSDALTFSGSLSQPYIVSLAADTGPLVVNDTGDAPNAPEAADEDRCDADPDAPGAQCTLRAAIELANARGGERVGFDVEDPIQVTSPLPPLGEGVQLAATISDPFGARTAQVDGGGGAFDGLVLEGAGSSVLGLSVTGFRGAGVVLRGEGTQALGVYVGLEADGSTTRPNGVGVLLDGPGVLSGSLVAGNSPTFGSAGSIGADDLGTGVLIRGEGASGARVVASVIGLDVTDTPKPNGVGVLIEDAPGVTVGIDGQPVFIGASSVPQGTAAPEATVDLRGVGLWLRGTIGGFTTGPLYVGLARDGRTPRPNAIGVLVDGVDDLTLGGTAPLLIAASTGVATFPPSDDGVARLSDVYGAGVAVVGADDVTLNQLWLGPDVTGTAGQPNLHGVVAFGADGLMIRQSTVLGVLHGVWIDAAEGQEPTANAQVVNSFIGLLPNGAAPATASEGTGVAVRRATDTQIGASGEGNVIAGWGTGVHIFGATDQAAAGARVAGNRIGMGPNGESVPTGRGIWVEGAASDVRIGGWDEAGERNAIDGGVAVAVTGDSEAEPMGVQIAGNLIGLAPDGVTRLEPEVGVFIGPSGALRGEESAEGGASGVRLGIPASEAGSAPAERRRNIIASAEEANVRVTRNGAAPQADPVLVVNNWIGLDAGGEGGLTSSTRDSGTEVGVRIDGTARVVVGREGEGNVIGGHQIGVWVDAAETEIGWNRIGTDPAGIERRANLIGIAATASGVRVGLQGGAPAPNVISGNALPGAAVDDELDGIGVLVAQASVLSGITSAERPPEDRPALPLARQLPPIRLSSASKREAGGLVEGVAVAHNLIGLTADGTAAVVPTDDIADTDGVVVGAGAVGAAVYANTIGGHEAGIALGNIIEDGRREPFPTGTHIAGNRVGLAQSSETPVPNRVGGIVALFSRDAVIGEGAVEGQPANLVAFSGTEGSGSPPGSFGSPGVLLLHPETVEDLEIDAPTGRHTLRANRIWANEGLGIVYSNDSDGPSVDRENVDPDGNRFDAPLLYAATGDASGLSVELQTTGAGRVEVFASPACDDSGYGEAQVVLGAAQVPGPGIHVMSVNAVPAPDWRVSATLTNASGTTSDLARCQAVAASAAVASVEVDEGETPTVEGPDLTVEVTNNPSGATRPRGTKARATGRLYLARHQTTPDSGAFVGAAMSGDGTTVAPDDVQRQRFWSVRAAGLEGVTYRACLGYGDLVSLPKPGQIVIVTRPHRGEPWTPQDTDLADVGGELFVCASELRAFGEFALGVDGGVNPVSIGPEATEIPDALVLSVYPNPSREAPTLSLSLPEATEVRAVVFDALGREVVVAHRGPLAAGVHGLSLGARGLAPGAYVVRVTVGGEQVAARFTIAR